MHLNLHLPLPHRSGRNLLNVYLFEEDWQSALTEIECHPRETRYWSSRPGFFDGRSDSKVLPLHVAFSVHAPLEVIRAIVEAYPEALEKKESYFKRLPLHVACQFAPSADVIEYLTQEYKTGVIEPDILGRLPLHYACANGAPLDVVRTLLQAGGAASCLYSDYNGWLPLHVAVHHGASTEVVEEMITVCPSAVSLRTRKRSTALSLAEKVQTKNREEVIALLKGVSSKPNSITVLQAAQHSWELSTVVPEVEKKKEAKYMRMKRCAAA